MTITEFILARVAEDEETAQRELADQAEWREQTGGLVGGVVAVPMCMGPKRVLAECEAKRKIVELVREWDEDPGPHSPEFWHAPMWDVLYALALPYADHPDYREGWTP